MMENRIDFFKNCCDDYHLTTYNLITYNLITWNTSYLTWAYSRIFFEDKSSLSGGVVNIEPLGKSGLVDGEKELSTLGSGMRSPFQMSWFRQMSCCRTWCEGLNKFSAIRQSSKFSYCYGIIAACLRMPKRNILTFDRSAMSPFISLARLG